MRVALALGAGGAGARSPWHASRCTLYDTQCDRHATKAATEHTRILPWHRGRALQFGDAAGRRALFSQIMCTSAAHSAPVCGECRRLLTRERLAIDILGSRVCPVTAEDMHHARAWTLHVAGLGCRICMCLRQGTDAATKERDARLRTDSEA